MSLLDNKRGLWAAVSLRFRAAHLLPAGATALVGLLASSSAVAQGNGVVQGTIIDASTKKPLGDVVVTLTSPALQGEQTVVTDGSGTYRIPNLPPGAYTLRLDKDAFRPYSRGGISMRIASTIRVNAELLPENVSLKAEEIVVVGKAPTVDVGSSSVGLTMNQDFTNHLPLNSGSATRSFENLAAVAPGAQSDRYGVSIAGTTSPENAFVIDGVSVNDPAFGVLGTPLSTEFVKEVGIIQGGYMPEYGRAMGGIFDVVTKSGSNEFHGSVFFNITPGALEGPRTQVLRDGTTITTNPSLGSLHDFGAEVGGPIIKDRLWFYAGVQAAFTRNKLARRLNEIQLDAMGNPIVDPATGFTQVKEIEGATKNYYADDRTIQYIGKLTYLFNQDHNIAISAYGTPTVSGGNGTFSNPTPLNVNGPYSAFASHTVANAHDLSLKYSGAFNNKHQLVDLTFGWHHQEANIVPNDGSKMGTNEGLAGRATVIYRATAPVHSIRDFAAYENLPAGACIPKTVPDPDNPGMTKDVDPCPVTTYNVGGPGFLDTQSLDSYQGRLVGTSLFTLAGHHVVKAGVDFQISTFTHAKSYSGGNTFRENGSGTNYHDYRQYGFLQAPDDAVIINTMVAKSQSTTIGGFIQDSWQIMDKVTLNAGFRYDTQIIAGADGTTGLALPNQWSPRVGVIYDFTQQGRSKIFANFARYYEGVPLDISDRSFPGEVQVGTRHRASTMPGDGRCDPAVAPDSEACRSQDPKYQIYGNPAFGNTTNNPNQGFNRTGGDKVPVDPDIAPQSSDEIVVGGEYEIFPDARIGVNYTHRYINRAIEDMSRDEANTYFIGNPGYGIAKDFPKATRDYDAVNFYFTKAFGNTWLAQASYTIATLRGNYAGLFRPETNQLDPNINSDFDLRSLLPNRTGALPGDRTHQIKLYAAKDFLLPGDMDVLVGVSFRTSSGSPLNYFGSHALYGANEVFILPRGSAGRNDWIHNFDARLGYSIRLGKQSTVGITMDVFNLFNFQGATARDQQYTASDVLPIPNGTTADLPTADSPNKLLHADGTAFDPKTELAPNFLNPTQYQNPRQFRFGAKVTF